MVKSQVQFENVDARFSKKSKLAAFSMSGDHFQELRRGKAARASDARNLKFGSGHGDMGIKP
jgi:hypothetical protein